MVSAESTALTPEQIKHMVDRFLGWRLPEGFHPDGGVSFERVGNAGTVHEYRRQPMGTNLLDATQAEAMVRYMLEGLPAAPDGVDPIGAAERAVGRWAYSRIEALMCAKPGTPDAAEVSWLAKTVEAIEEYGPEACGGKALADFTADLTRHDGQGEKA